MTDSHTHAEQVKALLEDNPGVTMIIVGPDNIIGDMDADTEVREKINKASAKAITGLRADLMEAGIWQDRRGFPKGTVTHL